MNAKGRMWASVVVLWGVLCTVATAQTPTFSVEVTGKNGVPVVPSTGSVLAAPGDILSVEVFVRDWSAKGDALKGYQVVFAVDGFTSGLRGNIHPKGFDLTTDLNGFCTANGTRGKDNLISAFVDEKRLDFVFAGLEPHVALDSFSCGYRYAAVLGDGLVGDPGVKKYCATLVVAVSADALGEFVLRLDETSVTGSFLAQGAGDPLTPLAFEPLTISVPSVDLDIVAADPPNGSIDPLQPSDPDGGNATGITEIEITFSGDAGKLGLSDFGVTVDPPGPAPSITSAIPSGNTITLQLDTFIPPGKWTIFTHQDKTPSSTRVGYLAGDVSGDGQTNPLDILTLVDALNGVVILSPQRTDINRSTKVNASDLLREIELLEGVGVFEVWNGRSLP